MKKWTWILVATLLLTLTACQRAQPQNTDPQLGSTPSTSPTHQTDPSTTPTSPTLPSTILPTEPTTEPTIPTTMPTTEPTIPPIDISEYEEYLKRPDLILLNTYRGDPDDIQIKYGQVANWQELEVGCTYIYNFEKMYAYLLSREGLIYQQYTSEHVYYILKDEPRTIYRSDYCMEETVVVYTSSVPNLTSFYFYGNDTNGQLFVCDNYQKIYSVDSISGEHTLLLDAYQIRSFSYSKSSYGTDWPIYANACNVPVSECGETIAFIGLLNENDPDPNIYPGIGNRYYSFLQIEECWIHYWNTSNFEMQLITKENTPEPPQPTEPQQIEIVGKTWNDIPVVAGIDWSKSGNGFFWSADGGSVFSIYDADVKMLDVHEISVDIPMESGILPVSFFWCQDAGEVSVFSTGGGYSLYPDIVSANHVWIFVNRETFILNLITLEVIAEEYPPIEEYVRLHIHQHDGYTGICIKDSEYNTHYLTGLPDIQNYGYCGTDLMYVKPKECDIVYLVQPNGAAFPVFAESESADSVSLYEYPKLIVDLTPDVWRSENSYLSYEEYFSVERKFEYNSHYTRSYNGDGRDWISTYKGNRYTFTAMMEKSGIVISSEAFASRYIVPDSQQYSDGYVLCADGEIAYVRFQTQILCIDLQTGDAEEVLDIPHLAYTGTHDGVILYYYTYDDARNLAFYRAYLPDFHQEMLFQFQMEADVVRIRLPDSTQSYIEITMWNPEFLDAMRRELADPDSIYKHDGWYDYSEYWCLENSVEIMMMDNYHWLHYFQDTIGIRAYLTVKWDPADDSLRYFTGVIDSCWYGSGYPHDHYHPDETTEENPIPAIGPWQSLNLDPWTGIAPRKDLSDGYGGCMIMSNEKSEGILYWNYNGFLKQLLDIPVKEATKENAYILCLTEDNRLLQISYDGQTVREVYRAQYGDLWELSCHQDQAVFLDGNTVIQINLQTGEYRTLLEQDHMLEMCWWNDYDEEADADELYFAVVHGMFYQQYVLNVETGEIEKVHFL